MAEETDKKIKEKDIVGLKYFDQLGCARASLGSLSDSVAVFDSERLKPIIESLGEKLVPIAAVKRLKDVKQTLTLVDGSIVEALPRIAMASFREAQSGSGKKMKWTLRTHEMICWYFCGMADQEELLAHLAKFHKPSEPRKLII